MLLMPQILILKNKFNKIDLVKDYFYIPPKYEKAIRISAKETKYIDDLLKMIEKELYQENVNVTFNIPYTRGDLVNLLNTKAEVLNIKYEDDIEITANVDKVILNQLKIYIKQIK